MPKINKVLMNVGELKDVDVLRISLVDRGANRVPFRFVKRDSSSEGGKDVIDFKLPLLKRALPIEVTAVAVGPDVDLEKAAEVVKNSGFETEGREWAEAQDGNRVLPLVDDFDPAKGQFVKFSDQAGAFLSNAKDLLQKADGAMIFQENLGERQFLPGLSMATDALFASVLKSLDEAGSAEQAVQEIKGVIDGFGAVVVEMAGKIPASLFKLETGLEALEDAGEPAGDPEDKKTETEKSEDEPEGEPTEDKVEKGEGDDPAGTSDSEGKVDKSEDAPEPEPKVGDVLKAVQGLTEQVGKLTETVDGLGSRVEKAEQAAEEAQEAAARGEARTTAVGGPSGGDLTPGRRERTQKRAIPLLDTATRVAS